MTTKTFTISASNKNSFVSQIDKLNKRAAKLSVNPITYTFSKAFKENDELKLKAEIQGPLYIEVNDWTFIATLTHLVSGETLIQSITETIIPNEYKTRGSLCDHCGSNRKRNQTYLLIHEDGQIKQVGSSCMQDFLGGLSVSQAVAKADFAADIVKSLTSIEQMRAGANQYYLPTFLETTAAVIREHGWIPKSKASSMGKPTVEYVFENLNPPSIDYPVSMIEDSDVAVASEALAWAESLVDNETEKSDYHFNIRSIALGGAVEVRTAALASSMIQAYKSHMNFHSPKMPKEKSKSVHQGNVGDAYVGEVVLRIHREFVGERYTTYFYSFEDEKGNVLAWRASKQQNLVEGNRYLLKGTIKGHEYYREVAQTNLTRCSLYLMTK